MKGGFIKSHKHLNRNKMESKTKNAKRRRHNNRQATHCRIRNRVGTSYGQPVPVGFYLHPLLDNDGKPDREKIVKRFNTKYDG
jgi:hypothetical protein